MKLSVALCTYNGAEYLDAQLASISRQTRLPDEVVIRDDCSMDATRSLLESFAKKAPFPVNWSVNQATLGSTQNFASAIGCCTGDAIVLCDQDDVWQPEKLARFESVFEKEPEVMLVASDLEVVGADLQPRGMRMWQTLGFPPRMRAVFESGGGSRQLLRFNVIAGAALAFRSSLRELCLPIPSQWMHDHWIALVATAVAPVRLLPEPLLLYRQHSDQQVGARERTLGNQVESAKRRTAESFASRAAGFSILARKLESIEPRLLDPGSIQAAREAVAHAQVLQRMREGSRLERVYPAIRELLSGRYHRYGRGFKSFAADVLL